MREFVRTDQGSGWVNQAEPIVHSGHIFIGLVPVTLVQEGRRAMLPPGTPFVRSHDLARRTSRKPREEQRTHLIVEEGLHHVERLCRHVRSSERYDHAVMVLRHDQIKVIAKELSECGQLSFEGHERLTVALGDVRTSFDEWKKNEHKQTVRSRIDTANAQRSRAGRFKPAPAALTAFASTTHIRRRLEEIIGIHAAFSANGLEVRVKLEEIWQYITAAWIEMQPDGVAARGIARAMDHRSRGRIIINIALSNVRSLEANLEGITAQPYRPLADAAVATIKDLRWCIKECRRKRADEAGEHLRYLLRRMRMLWFVERSLIHILSFLPDDGTQPDGLIRTFRDRLEKADVRVRDLGDTEFDPSLRTLVQEYIEATRTNLKTGDYDRARDELKHLTHELRIQPVSGRKAA